VLYQTEPRPDCEPISYIPHTRPCQLLFLFDIT